MASNLLAGKPVAAVTQKPLAARARTWCQATSSRPFNCSRPSRVAGSTRTPGWTITATPQHKWIGLQPCAAGGLKEPGSTELIPIFPLGIVAMPSVDQVLNIFEARYRVLFSTLLAGSTGIDEGLVNHEQPWCGTKTFGMNFADRRTGQLSVVGTTLLIDTHTTLEDGRILIKAKGVQRYRIKEVKQKVPVVLCEVQYLLDMPDSDTPEAHNTADELRKIFKTTLELNLKMRKFPATPEAEKLPEEMSKMSPRELSFWFAGLLEENPMQQQALLEISSTVERLQQERDMLKGTMNFLSATLSLESALGSSGSGEGSEVGGSGESSESSSPPTDGPD